MTKTSSPREAETLVQKLPSDMGIHRNPRKGTLNAPEVILEDFDFLGTVFLDEVFPDEFDLEETHRRIEENTRELLEYGKPLLGIGGDHSVSFPVIKALKERHSGLQLVWLDAHLDMKEPVDGHASHDVVLRELIGSGFEPSELWVVGVTRVDQDEEELMEQHDFNIYRSNEVEEFRREFDSGEQPVYLSVDIDVLDPEEAPGTGYPDGELSPEQAGEVIETVEPDFADLVEVAPPLEEGNRTAENARVLLRRLSEAL
ncbi:MAG: arginase family protein [Candidatus Nanohaloarchaea archaeon]